MDYQRIYDAIIKRRLSEPPTEYAERHRIVPGCMGEKYEEGNVVFLSAREHFIAHWLLYKIHRTVKLAHAWYAMCRVGAGQEHRYVNSKHFEKAKQARSQMLSENSKGEGNHFYGKTHSDEAKQLIRAARLGTKTSDATRAKMSAVRKGVPKTMDHRMKIGKAGLVPLKNINTGESVRVARAVLSQYDDAWVNHYTYKLMHAENITCPHCGRVGKETSTFKRWHFDNCKHEGKST